MDHEATLFKLAGRVNSLEKWPVKQIEALETLLAEYPWAHGYWIRLAKAEFCAGRTEAAWQCYERAVTFVPFSSQLWSSYIQFCILTNAPQTSSVVDRAISLSGDQFLSHELWDAVLDWERSQESVEGVVRTLRLILGQTLHQFARYYDFLRRIVQSDKIPPELLGQSSKQMALDDLYTLLERQQSRVSEAWTYEKNLRRQFFHPRPLPSEQHMAWVAAIKLTKNRESVYRRWLCVEPLNSDVWLGYIRWLLAEGKPVLSTFQLADKSLPEDHDEVRLYFALWLEWVGKLDDAQQLYRRLKTPRAVVSFSQFCERLNPGSGLNNLHEALENPSLWSWPILQEAVRIDANAFKKYPPPPKANPPRAYWQSYLAAYPEMAEEIWMSAPEGLVTKDYLKLLAKTDPIKFMELDRTVHRKAL